MELKASKILSALDFLQTLAQNPLQSVSSKNRSILDEIRNSYLPKTTGKKRKQSSKPIGPKPKRQKTHKKHKPKSSDKQETDHNHNQSNSEDSDIDTESVEEEEVSTDSQTSSDNTHNHNRPQLISDSATQRNINGDSPSHLTYFRPSDGIFAANNGALSPLYSRGEPRHNDLDNYLSSIGKIFYHPIEAMEEHNGADHDSMHMNKKNIFRYSSINLILSPLRKRSPFDEWNPREIALFESGICSKGKQFYEISKIIGSKNTKQCVEFYYFWKQSAHYTIWKALGKKSNKKLSKAQKKLHQKIGHKFAQFHRRNIGKNSEKIIDLPSLTTHLEDVDGDGDGDEVVQQQNDGGQGQQMGIIGYYPQYYTAQNGYGYGHASNGGNGGYGNGANANGAYPSWYGGNVYNMQYQAQPLQEEEKVNDELNDENENENGADFIDLTETASSNGTKSATPKEGGDVIENVSVTDIDFDDDDL